jgi:hypothetical protein
MAGCATPDVEHSIVHEYEMKSKTIFEIPIIAGSFWIYRKQRTVICFFTPKKLKARAIHTELKSVYGLEALILPTAKKWQRRFHQGRTDLVYDLRSGRPLANDLAGAIDSVLEERPFRLYKLLCCRSRIGKATCMRVLHGKPVLKISIFAGCCVFYRSIRRIKECHIRGSSSSDDNDRTERERLSTECHRG